MSRAAGASAPGAVAEDEFWSQQREGTVLIVGMSDRTGLPAAQLLGAKGVRFRVSDCASREELEPLLAQLDVAPERVFSGPQEGDQLDGIGQVIVAPGVPRTIPLLREARRRAIPVQVDIDFLYPVMARKTIVAITGTDGKTTTTTLTGELLKPHGSVLVAGNIGVSVLAKYDEMLACDWLVLEVSSFMLEQLSRFRPNIAAILNIGRDHIDRHATPAIYAAAKFDIVRYCQPGDVLVKNIDDPTLAAFCPDHVTLRTVSRTTQAADSSYRDGSFFIGGQSIRYSDCRLKGIANIDNILIAATIARSAGVAFDAIAEGVRAFAGLRHRLQHLGTFGGVDIYEDSKASNVHAVEAALRNFERNVVLIIGGRDKGLDFTVLRAHAERLKCLVCYGESGQKLRHMVGLPGALYTFDFEGAVRLAAAQCQAGDVLLLSPGCTSWDQHDNYEVRGDQFQSLAPQCFA
jgi:UDP-N-acetylmuramoylalanine--D-glutamate ligase